MFLLVDKPQWYTSHDVVEKVKRLYRWEKVWHGGTLDPMATGLLVIAIGKDTKKLWSLLWAEKTYLATIDFSVSTDTWDMDYRQDIQQWKTDPEQEMIEVDWKLLSFPTQAQLKHALERIRGEHPLPLTPFSAKKVHGKKLYEYAREGNPLFLDVSMTLLSYTIREVSFPCVTLALTVWSGTYIRSIGYRLGKQFGLWGTLTMLRRTAVGKLNVPDDSISQIK